MSITNPYYPEYPSTLGRQDEQTAVLEEIAGSVAPVGGLATANNQVLEIAELTDINGKLPNVLGQTLMAASLAVVIASDQSVIPVSGPLTDAQLRATPVPISGTVTANQGTSPWVISGAVTGPLTDAQLRSTPVPVSLTSTTITGTVAVTQSTSPWVTSASQSGTWTVQQGTPPWSVAGNVASGAADTGNPVKAGGVYNSTDLALSTGQRGDLQLDASGRLKTANLNTKRASYSAAVFNLVIAASATDIFTITGSGSKTVRISKIVFTGTRTASSNVDVLLIKRSTANSGGTSTAPTIVPYDSTNAAPTATVLAYTANPVLGTTVGNLRSAKAFINSSGAGQTQIAEASFGGNDVQEVVLRGTSELVAINMNAATIAGSSFNLYVEWTEE